MLRIRSPSPSRGPHDVGGIHAVPHGSSAWGVDSIPLILLNAERSIHTAPDAGGGAREEESGRQADTKGRHKANQGWSNLLSRTCPPSRHRTKHT